MRFIEESHQYFLGDRELMCVSNVTHMFQEHFDSETMAYECYERHFDDFTSKYYQMTPEMILEAWKKISDDACSHGTNVHEFGESCFYFMTRQYDRILDRYKDRLHINENGNDYFISSEDPKEVAVVEFWEALPKSIVPIAAENKVFNIKDEYAYSGTFDILFYYDPAIDGKVSNNEGLMVFDYKTNKDLYKNFKLKKLLSPFDELLDMPLSIYKLQLTAYQMCLEKVGLHVVARRIIWLLPNGTFQKIPLEEYCKMLDYGLKQKDTKITK